ncbi:MAG: PQQ-binding-like beta-propeller repeat protein [Actinomycetales bacterium]|nr:PQQ-binding-like beta-propeller repeat protein [Actinomycetales bacterium]
MADLVEVELDDELEPLPERRRRPRGPWSMRRWAWATTGLAVALATATVAGGVGAAALSAPGPGGLTTDLTVPRHARWSEPGAQLIGAVGDLVLVTDELRNDVRALRVGDGTQVWRADGSCTLAPLGGPAAEQIVGGPTLVADPRYGRVVCTDAVEDAPVTRVLDPATGAVLAQVPQQLTVIGDYLVDLGAATVDQTRPPQKIAVRALADGAELWSRELDPTNGQAEWGTTPTALVLADMVPSGGMSMSRVDLASGEMSPVPADAVVPLLEFPVADGRTGTTGWRATGQLASVVADAGGVVWARDGYGVIPARVHDDGPEVLLAAGPNGGTAALEPETGSVLWSAEVDGGFPLVQVAGVVLTGTASPSLRDERTGEVRWTVPGGEMALSASDGTNLLLRDLATGALVVRDLRDGREVTRYTVPGMSQSALVVDAVALSAGRLAVVTTDGLTLLAP